MLPESEPGSGYFIDTTEVEVRRLLGSPLTDLTVRSTIGPALQSIAEQVVGHWLMTEGPAKHIGLAALLALAPDAAVLAMVGGRVIDMARSLGVRSDLPVAPSLALGPGEVSLLEMTAAMDAIAVNADPSSHPRCRQYERMGRGRF